MLTLGAHTLFLTLKPDNNNNNNQLDLKGLFVYYYNKSLNHAINSTYFLYRCNDVDINCIKNSDNLYVNCGLLQRRNIYHTIREIVPIAESGFG